MAMSETLTDEDSKDTFHFFSMSILSSHTISLIKHSPGYAALPLESADLQGPADYHPRLGCEVVLGQCCRIALNMMSCAKSSAEDRIWVHCRSGIRTCKAGDWAKASNRPILTANWSVVKVASRVSSAHSTRRSRSSHASNLAMISSQRLRSSSISLSSFSRGIGDLIFSSLKTSIGRPLLDSSGRLHLLVV